MQRRHLLAAAGGALAGGLAGCLGVGERPEIRTAIDRPRADRSEPGAGCSDALQRPLSERLIDDPGEDPGERHGTCSEPALAVANVRAAAVDVELELPLARDRARKPSQQRQIEAGLELQPGERVVLRHAVEPGAPLAGTVVVDGDEHAVEWPARSCRRHGLAIVPDGVEIGWIEPAAGWGGPQHFCYVGETLPVRVRNRGGARTVRVAIEDPCTGSERSQRFAFASEGSKLLDEPAVTGRDYEIEVDGIRVDAASATYEGHCQPPQVLIDRDGAVEVRPLGIM